MGSLQLILGLANIAIPAISNVIVAIRDQAGGVSAMIYLDQADAQFSANQKAVSEWLTSHGKTVAPGT